jgi:hypothetical protein
MNLLPAALQPTKPDDGSLAALIYFYQLAAIAVPDGQQKLADDAAALFCASSAGVGTNQIWSWAECIGVAGQNSSENIGFCIAKDVDFREIRLLDLAPPVILFMLLHLVSACLGCISSQKNNIAEEDCGTAGDMDEPLLHSKVDADEGAQQEAADQQGFPEEVPCDLEQNLDDDINGHCIDGENDGHPALPKASTTITNAPGSTAPAVASMLLYCYGSMTSAVFQLLNCVDFCDFDTVPHLSSQQCSSRLFYAGDIECGLELWQLLAWVLLCVLVMLPAVPVTIWVLQTALPPYWKLSIWLTVAATRVLKIKLVRKAKSTSLIRALRADTTGTFTDRHWHWAALLVLQRLLMVSVSVFFNVAAEISVGMLCVSTWFLLFQIYAAPYKSQHANALQTLASSCLVGITIMNSVPSGFTSAGFDPAGTRLGTFQDNMYIIMGVLLLVPLLVWLVMLIMQFRASKQTNRTGLVSTGQADQLRQDSIGDGAERARRPPTLCRHGWATAPSAVASRVVGPSDSGSTQTRVAGEVFAAQQAERRLELDNSELRQALEHSRREAADQAALIVQHSSQISRFQSENAQLRALHCEQLQQQQGRTQITPHMAATPERTRSRQQQHSHPGPSPNNPTGPGASSVVVTANGALPARSFFNTQQSACMRAADPKALVGQTIEVGVKTGVVKAVVAKAGGSSLHTVEFDSGRVANIHLAKRPGGKGAKFHVAGKE